MTQFKKIVKRIPGVKSLQSVVRDLNHRNEESFKPYIKSYGLSNIDGEFFFATQQASIWYDPIKPHALAEYEWLLEHIPLKNERIIDAGAHHGHYSVVFALGAQNTGHIVAVDPQQSNLAIVRVNVALNDCDNVEYHCVAVNNGVGSVQFSLQSNGHIVDSGGITVRTEPLTDIMADATIVKLDIEGAEFHVLPHHIDLMSDVHTWIIEIHPSTTDKSPDELVQLLLDRGFNCYWVNIEKQVVEPYVLNTIWTRHTTLIATTKA